LQDLEIFIKTSVLWGYLERGYKYFIEFHKYSQMAVRILTKGYEYFVKLYKCFQILINVPRPLEYLSNGMNMLYHFQNNYRPWKYLQKE